MLFIQLHTYPVLLFFRVLLSLITNSISIISYYSLLLLSIISHIINITVILTRLA